jgi:hypothetical protein
MTQMNAGTTSPPQDMRSIKRSMLYLFDVTVKY